VSVSKKPRLARLASSITVLGLIVGLPAVGLAQSARAYLSQSEATINGQFILNVEISDAQELDADPILPDLSGFAAYLGSGTSTSMQIVNGRTSTSLTIQYRFQATAEGTFDIGSVMMQVAGQSLHTEPLNIKISNTSTRRSTRRDDGGIAPEDLFIVATPSKQRVYVNEPVVVEYRIFTRVDVEGYNLTRPPSTAGFWVEELEDPQGSIEQMVRNGIEYASTVIRRLALFPTSAGVKILEPLTIEAQVRVRQRSRSPFGDPFLGGGLFGSRVPIVVESDPIEIEVLPHPTGQPDSFTGLVGRLTVSASIDKTNVDTNDALTYRLVVSGTGNVRTLAEPALGFPSNFEIYPPDVSERVEATIDGVQGIKTFEYVIVPRAPGLVTLPAVELAYFNIDSGDYALAASEPIVLTIAGNPGGVTVGPSGRVRTGIDLQRQDIRFIRVAIPDFRQIDGSLAGSPFFWAILLMPLCAVTGAVALRRHQNRLQGDVAYARRRRASRLAKQRLVKADSLCSPDRHREFHAEIGRALQGFLGDKLNVPEAGLIREEIRAKLTSRVSDSDVVDAYLSCLEACDRERFAPAEPDQAVMHEILTRAGHVMTNLDQALS